MKGVYQKRGFFYFQPPTPKGGVRPRAIALKTQDEVEAIEAATRHLHDGMLRFEETRGTMGDLLPRYYAARSEDRETTKRARKVILEGFKNRMGNPRVADISREMILRWRALVLEKGGSEASVRGVTPTSVVSYLITIRAFLNWCVAERLIRENPAKRLGKAARQTRRQEFLTIQQRDRLLARKGREEVMLVLYLGFYAGLRVGEMQVANPDWFHIAPDWSYGSVTVCPTMIRREAEKEGGEPRDELWQPKTARGVRTIPLHPELLRFLREYGLRGPYLLAPDKVLFPAVGKQSRRFDVRKGLANHAKACAVKKVGYHMLRHSFATHLAMGGASVQVIAGFMGNSPKVTEESYAGFAPDLRNLLPGL